MSARPILVLRRRGRGLGDAGNGCPSFAPYTSSVNGFCTNVAPTTSPSVPAGSIVTTDTFTGAPVAINAAVQSAINQVGVLQNSAAAEAQAREAERQGAALGVPTTCQVERQTDLFGGGLVLFPVCTVGGQAGHSAAALVRPGGFQIAVTEINSPGSGVRPVSPLVPFLTVDGGYGSGAAPAAVAPRPVDSGGGSAGSSSSGRAGAGGSSAGGSAAPSTAVASWLDSLRSVPMQYWLGGGALVALYFLSSALRGGRR